MSLLFIFLGLVIGIPSGMWIERQQREKDDYQRKIDEHTVAAAKRRRELGLDP